MKTNYGTINLLPFFIMFMCIGHNSNANYAEILRQKAMHASTEKTVQMTVPPTDRQNHQVCNAVQ